MSDKYFPPDCTEIVRRALVEDIGSGDITTLLTVDAEVQAEARVVAKQTGIVAGLSVLRQTFLQVDPALEFSFQC